MRRAKLRTFVAREAIPALGVEPGDTVSVEPKHDQHPVVIVKPAPALAVVREYLRTHPKPKGGAGA